MACDRGKSSAASKAGLERLDVRFACAGGRALVAHILARNRAEGGGRFLSVIERLRRLAREGCWSERLLQRRPESKLRKRRCRRRGNRERFSYGCPRNAGGLTCHAEARPVRERPACADPASRQAPRPVAASRIQTRAYALCVRRRGPSLPK